MSTKFYSSILFMVILSTAAGGASSQAAPVCDSAQACLNLRARANAAIEYHKLGRNVFLNPVGDKPAMNRKDAIQICALRNGHLPGTLEVAYWAMSRGAMGVQKSIYPSVPISEIASGSRLGKELKGEIDALKTEGFQPIFRSERTGGRSQAVVDFYFSYYGYQAPENVQSSFWTATPDPSKTEESGYFFEGDFGTFDSVFVAFNHAVLCAVGS
jgi:hypothetical protein